MSYIKQNLEPNETVKAQAKVNWLAIIPRFIPFIIMIIISIFIIPMIEDSLSEGLVSTDPDLLVMILTIKCVFAGFCLVMLLRPYLLMIKLLTTELVFTNVRVISKVGLISRHVNDAQLVKVDNVGFTQYFWGKIFNYGTISISTTSDIFLAKYIKNANDFKNMAMKEIEVSKKEESDLIAKNRADEMAKIINL